MRTLSRGHVYLGGALWQILHSAVNGVEESAIFGYDGKWKVGGKVVFSIID